MKRLSPTFPVHRARRQTPDEQVLRKLFRGAMLACVGGPLLLGDAACGGTTASSGSDAATSHTDATPHSDGATRDARSATDGVVVTVPDGSMCTEGCGGCGGNCGPGCAQTMTCVNGAPVYGCNCSTPEDAGLSCDPDRSGNFYLPLYCFDAALGADGSTLSPQQCEALCGVTSTLFCGVVLAAGNSHVLSCEQFAGGGRRPSGFRPPRSRAGSVLGEYFARMANLESASVVAFETLRDELAAHGAPAELVRAADAAIGEERMHTRLVGALARAHGSSVARPKSRRPGVRPLEAIAIENEVEGCVRESFGALTATWQAAHARDPKVRAVMARVAVDEVGHAALSWAVSAWAATKLDDAANARVAAARHAAVAELLTSIDDNLAPTLRTEAGLPGAEQSRHLLATLTRDLWARDATAA